VTVAVVGLGAMGSRIARRLLDTGREVVVWNRDAAKAAPLVERGASAARSPAEAAARVDVVITMVSNPEALRAVTEGPDAVAAGASASTTVIQMSTVAPAAVSRLAAVLQGRAELLDAPVLGSVTEAEAGRLRVFAGGEPTLVERWTPLLSALGTVVHVGPLGAGTAAKLVANSTLLGVLGILGEALALADGLGLPRAVTFDVLAATPLAAQAERRRAAVESGEYPVRFTLALARKDADLILDAATASGVELRLIRAARAWLADAEQAGMGDDDYAAVLAAIADARPTADS
jgi:3-hydroxyisobutyrate dehydrogenase-like beta-hydroxyacid dehydrogenase